MSIRLSSYLPAAVTRLRASDLEAVFAVVAEAHAIDGPEPFTTELLGQLAELVPCERVFLNERDVVQRHLIARINWYSEDLKDGPQPITEDVWSLIARHPLNVYRRRTGDFGVRKLSDFYSRRQRVRQEVFPECFTYPIVDFIGIALWPSYTYTLNFGFESQRRDFTESDRLVLEILRPHLSAAYRHAAVRRRLTAALVALDAGAEEGRPAVVLLERGRIEFASRPARRLLESYFGEQSGRLPTELDRWLREGSAGKGSYTQIHGRSRLVVDAEPGNRSVLLLREEPSVALTPREWDVIRCVAAGMSNTETAGVLWVTLATVRKHLENIYAKLGVRSRTAALAKLGPHVVGGRQATGVAVPTMPTKGVHAVAVGSVPSSAR